MMNTTPSAPRKMRYASSCTERLVNNAINSIIVGNSPLCPEDPSRLKFHTARLQMIALQTMKATVSHKSSQISSLCASSAAEILTEEEVAVAKEEACEGCHVFKIELYRSNTEGKTENERCREPVYG